MNSGPTEDYLTNQSTHQYLTNQSTHQDLEVSSKIGRKACKWMNVSLKHKLVTVNNPLPLKPLEVHAPALAFLNACFRFGPR